jgi:diphthine-ammonia ligase
MAALEPAVIGGASTTASGLAGAQVYCSWSGGKDSALALHEAVGAGAEPRFLVSMLTEGGERSRSHGLPRGLLAAQAAAIGVPIRFGAATWAGYRKEFVRVVGEGIAATDARAGVFGDIDTDEHRDWEEGVCAEVGTEAVLPLWRRDRRAVTDQLLASGFEAVIVAVRDGVLPPSLLGRTLDQAVLAKIEAAGADACGENGEFHTFVVDGPIFRGAVDVELGQVSLRDGVWFVDLLPTRPPAREEEVRAVGRRPA